MCKIKFDIKDPGPIEVRVVDIIGLTVTSFFNEYEPGTYEVEFNEEKVLPGSYFYRVLAPSENCDPVQGENAYNKLLQTGTLKVKINGFNKQL